MTENVVLPITGTGLQNLVSGLTLPSNGGFVDIGSVRIQWGINTQGVSTERTVTLPAPFANTSYSVVLTSDNGTNPLAFAPRVGTVGSKTTTNFRARMALLNLDPSMIDFSWMAIGAKP
jgi:hypothetical protein